MLTVPIRSLNAFFSSITNLSSIQVSHFFNDLWGRQNSLCWQCSSFLPLTSVCWIHTSATIQMSLIIHIWKFTVYTGATLYPFCHRSNPGAKVCPIQDGVSATTIRVDSQTNPYPMKLFVPVEVWDRRLLAYTLDSALGITLWQISHPWASYQIRNIAGCACAGNAGNVFPRRRIQRKPLVSDPGMPHGTCVTHVPWCMSGSLTCGDGENVPGIPGACAPAILRIWKEVYRQCISPVCPTMYIKFSFRTSPHISGLEYIIRSKTLCSFFVLCMFESYNTLLVHPIPFLLSVVWCDRGEHRLFVFLLRKIWGNFIYGRCVYEVEPQAAPKHILWRKYT